MLSTVLPVLGDTTFNICMNDRAYWHNVAAPVWGMTTLGGYQVLNEVAVLAPIHRKDECRGVLKG